MRRFSRINTRLFHPSAPSLPRFHAQKRWLSVSPTHTQTESKRGGSLTLFLSLALASYTLTHTLTHTQSPSRTLPHAHCEGSPLSRNFVADVVETVSPAVVNIVVSSGFRGLSASSGSGFIIDSAGVIITNAHVVASSADGQCLVTLHNGRKLKAVVHSVDVASDLAVVKVLDVREPLTTVRLGSSSKVRSGEFVVAIGSPMHLQNSASLGIVSATARHASELGLANSRSEYIQTDAAINQGNSGGPLVNLDGEVIGINSMKVADSDGISFAIPIDIAQQIVSQLLRTGKVTRPFVGMKMANMLRRETENGGNGNGRRTSRLLSTDETVVVVLDVVRGSPAHQAGLESGDVVLEINGKKATAVRDVLDAIGLDVGKTHTLKIRKVDGQEVTKQVTSISSPRS